MPVEIQQANNGQTVNVTAQYCDSARDGQAAIPLVIGVALTFPIIAIAAVILRFVTIRLRKTLPTADDWVILAALIPSTTFCFIVVAAELDQSRRIQVDLVGIDDPAERCVVAVRDYTSVAWPAQWSVAQGAASDTAIVGTVFHISAVALVKCAILLLYGKIFTKRSMQIIVKAGLAFIILFWLPFFIFDAIIIHVATSATYSLQNSVTFCTILIVLAVMDLVTDVALLILPIFYIIQLRMSMSKKFQTIGMFGIGIVCIVASIARLVYIVKFWQYVAAIERFGSSPAEPTRGQIANVNVLARLPMAQGLVVWRNCMIWTFVEPCTSILAACLPTYRPLVDAVSKYMSSWSSRARIATAEGRCSYEKVDHRPCVQDQV